MKIFAANWKLQKSPKEAREFFTELLGGANRPILSKKDRRLIIFPSSPCLEAASDILGASPVWWGAQNCYSEGKGAFTGEISAQIVKDLGGQVILVGHSERRVLFNEGNEFIAKKVGYVQSLGLIPMLCFGETLSEREGERPSP